MIGLVFLRGSHKSSLPFSLSACTKGFVSTQREKTFRNRKEGPHQTLNLPTPWTFSLKNCNKCLSFKPFSLLYFVTAVQAD